MAARTRETLMVLAGSDGLVEIAVREGSAALFRGAGPGAEVKLSRRARKR